MKAIIIVALCLSSFSASGQYFPHATTSNVTDRRVLKICTEVERQLDWMISLNCSPENEERAMRAKMRSMKYLPGMTEYCIGNIVYYEKDFLSEEEKSEVLDEISLKDSILCNAKYNILFIKNNNFYFQLNDQGDSLLYESLFPDIALYQRVNTSFEISKDIWRWGTLAFRPFKPDRGEITFKYFFYDDLEGQYGSAPAHEFSHLSTDANFFIPRETQVILDDICKNNDTMSYSGLTFNFHTGKDYGYYNNPTEIKARVDALRWLLYRENIFDARYSDFTDDNLVTMKENHAVMDDQNVCDLFDEILKSESDLIWLMNYV